MLKRIRIMLKRIGYWKYVVAIIAIWGCALYVSQQYEKARQQCGKECNQARNWSGSQSIHYEICDECQQSAEMKFPRWYRLFSWPEGITTWALILTLFAIVEQTAQTRKAAEAALLNAKAVIDAERAWIVVSIERESSPLSREYPGMTLASIIAENNRRGNEAYLANMKGKPKIFYVSCLNQGRTPARIISVCAAYRFVERPEYLPSPPDYSAPTRMPEQTFIVSRDSFKIQPGFSPRSVWENARKARSLKANDNFLIYYGRVVYEDIFAFGDQSTRVQRESRWAFCCFMDSDELPVRSSTGEYDRYT